MLLVVDDAGVAVLMLDSSQAEAKLFARDLTLSKERTQGIDRRGPRTPALQAALRRGGAIRCALTHWIAAAPRTPSGATRSRLWLIRWL